MRTSLVTGGSGFIGQHLVEQLVADGERVRILDLEPPARRQADVEFVQGSITDRPIVDEAMAGARHVYHTAAIPHLWIPVPSMFEEVNVGGTRIVFEAALKAGVERVIHTSSATVLTGGIAGGERVTLDERHRTEVLDLIGHYARSKWQAEQVALGFADRLPVVVVLPTLPLGPGDGHLTPPTRMLMDFLSGRNRAYIDSILNVIDVRDVAAGHRLAARFGRPGERYILNRHSLEMTSFLQHLEAITGRPMPKRRLPALAAVCLSAVFETWSNVVSGRAPIAPFAGTRMGVLPIAFDGRRAETELCLPHTPLIATLRDAIAWLSRTACLPAEIEASGFAFGRD